MVNLRRKKIEEKAKLKAFYDYEIFTKKQERKKEIMSNIPMVIIMGILIALIFLILSAKIS